MGAQAHFLVGERWEQVEPFLTRGKSPFSLPLFPTTPLTVVVVEVGEELTEGVGVVWGAMVLGVQGLAQVVEVIA
jgi:hypothetical protein